MSYLMERAILLASSGHIGHFVEPDRHCVYFEGEFLSPKPAPHPGVIKFHGFNFPPFLNFVRTGDSNFTVYGAWFSLLYETAKALNYSLVGMAPLLGRTEPQRDQALYAFRPDLVLIPFVAQVSRCIEMLDIGWIEISNFVYIAELDHILSAKKYKSQKLASMLAPFDSASLALTVTALLLTALIARHFKVRFHAHALNDFVWNLATALICTPEVTAKKAIWRFVGITWTLGVFLLQQLFAGEMFSAMALPPELDVIDSFAELATRTTQPITIFDFEEAESDSYLSPSNEFQGKLSERLQILPVKQMYNASLVNQVLVNVSSGINFHLGALERIDQYRNDLFGGEFKEKVHISKEHGQTVPMFLIANAFAEKRIKEAFNGIIAAMHENGIFANWVASYKGVKFPDIEKIVEYNIAELRHFLGLFVICARFFVLGLVVLGVELFVKNKSKFSCRKSAKVGIYKNAKLKRTAVIAERTQSRVSPKRRHSV